MFIFGRPVEVARDADKATMEQKRQELEDIMREITERADRYWEAAGR